jgi:cytochrome P450
MAFRFYAPTTMACQIEEDADLGGTTLSAGQLLMLPIPAANRDPAVFPDPNRLDLGPSSNKHLAFGIGIPRCTSARISVLSGPNGREKPRSSTS